MKISSLRPFRAIRESKLGKRISKKIPSFLSAFTLIEILVVISIIAVLASLLFPAMGAVRDSARKTSAKNDIVQIVNGIRNFYVDYGRYPLEDPPVQNADNKTVIGALRGLASGSSINPRQVRYLEVPEKSGSSTGGKVRSAVNKDTGDSTWFDPWSQPYEIFIDHDYDDEISVIYNTVNTTLRTGAAAKSVGKSGTNKKTDIGSWE